MDYETGDRRPIAARALSPIVRLAAWLVRVAAPPNAISVAGMACALLAGALLAWPPPHPAVWLIAAVLIQLRLLANVLDGMVAIGRGIASPLGELFNEVPDRVSDSAIFVGLGFAAGSTALGFAAALAAMATAYVRVLGRSLAQPSDFSGPMAKQHRMALVTVGCVVSATRPAFAGPITAATLYVITGLSLLTALRRLLRLGRALRAA